MSSTDCWTAVLKRECGALHIFLGDSIPRIYSRYRPNDSAIGLSACPRLLTVEKYIQKLHEQINSLGITLDSAEDGSLQQALEEDIVGRVYNLRGSHYFQLTGRTNIDITLELVWTRSHTGKFLFESEVPTINPSVRFQVNPEDVPLEAKQKIYQTSVSDAVNKCHEKISIKTVTRFHTCSEECLWSQLWTSCPYHVMDSVH